MNQGWTYTDTIKGPATGEGQTVLDYYTQRYTHSDQATWQARIEQGQIRLAGRPVCSETTLQRGQVLTYHRPPWQEPAVPLNFQVLYEDADLWAIAKPSGLPVLPGGRFLEHTLLHQLRQRYTGPGAAALPPGQTPTPVHRLGRGTSGVMLVAKSQQARAALARQFREHTASQEPSETGLFKRYRALIGPATPTDLPQRFTCTTPIGKLPYPRLGYVYGAVSDGQAGLPARSEGQVLQRRPEATLLRVEIATGRPHQIRIHLAAAGYPLLGDPLYQVGGTPVTTGSAIPSDCGYHLHAHQICFMHPKSGQPITITAPLPARLRVAP